METFLIIFVIAAAVMIYYTWFRQKKHAKDQAEMLADLLAKRQFEEFDTLINDEDTQSVLSEFDLAHLRFTSAMIKGNKDEADLEFENIKLLRSNDKQKASFYSGAMPYYISRQDHQKSMECYEAVRSLKGFEEIRESVSRVYRIMELKQDSDLEVLLEELKHVRGEQYRMDAMLIAEIYRHQGKENLCHEYMKIAERGKE